eukprot:3001457-Prymnesium_polylepis.1
MNWEEEHGPLDASGNALAGEQQALERIGQRIATQLAQFSAAALQAEEDETHRCIYWVDAQQEQDGRS